MIQELHLHLGKSPSRPFIQTRPPVSSNNQVNIILFDELIYFFSSYARTDKLYYYTLYVKVIGYFGQVFHGRSVAHSHHNIKLMRRHNTPYL